MSAQTPLKLEFNYVNLPHPAGSDNTISIQIVPAGDVKSVLAGDYSLSLGTSWELQDALSLAADFLVADVKKGTSQSLSDTISFTDEQGNQTVLPTLAQP